MTLQTRPPIHDSPYVRSLITTYTSNSNVPPLILPPINVVKMMEDK
ncbi:hypothetical protein FPQ13_12760 [Allobacillus salarius]|uniref:Uncharacterized protein n=1 Tax=Allobacillus salarius TaxID=1955272 RepID=A0A556P6D9_9BACI|nr:hypothetical protein FPQ13_12760 [Allobacillus salarius]